MLTLHVHKIAPSNTFVKRIFKKIFDISVKCDIIFTVPIIGIASYINTEIFMKNHSKKDIPDGNAAALPWFLQAFSLPSVLWAWPLI